MYKHDYSLTRMPRLSDDVGLQPTSSVFQIDGYFGDIPLGDDMLPTEVYRPCFRALVFALETYQFLLGVNSC